MKATILIRLKEEVPDGPGELIKERLANIGFREIKSIRVGKLVEIDMEGGDVQMGKDRVKVICEQLLVNEVIEEFEVVSIQ